MFKREQKPKKEEHKKFDKSSRQLQEDDDVQPSVQWNVHEVKLNQERNQIPEADPKHEFETKQEPWKLCDKETVGKFFWPNEVDHTEGADEDPFADSLITEVGLKREQNAAKSMHKVKNDYKPKLTSALKVINNELIEYREQMTADIDNFKTIKMEYENQAKFKGLCPYGHNQAFWYNSKLNKLFKGTFRAGNLVQKQELAMSDRKDEILTYMEILGKYLVLGFFDGSFDIISLENKEIASKLTIKAVEDKGFVRDVHLRTMAKNGDLYLVTLFVNQTEEHRSYNMAHFVLSLNEAQELELIKSSETAHLYSIPNDDKTHKLQHRVEFYWWEKLRNLGSKGVALPYGHLKKKEKRNIKDKSPQFIMGILDIKKCHNDQNFVKAHTAYTGCQNNWVFRAPKGTKRSVLSLIIVNNEGVFFERDLDGDGKQEFVELANPWQTNGSKATEPWMPMDCEFIAETCTLVIAGTMGLFTINLQNPDEAEIQLVGNDNYFNIVLSPCQRILVATGRTEKIEVYNAKTMQRHSSLPYRHVYHLKMTSDQIFFQYKELGSWCVIDLQENDVTRTLQPNCRIPVSWTPDYRKMKYQRILYDKVQKNKIDGQDVFDTHIVGIVSKERQLKPPLVLSRYPGFMGSKVEAVDLNPVANDKSAVPLPPVCMMDQEEADEKFYVVSVNLHENLLTWMLVRNPMKEGDLNLKIRQADMRYPSNVKTVTIPEKERFKFMLFGGFYLTVIRRKENADQNSAGRSIEGKGKNGDAIIVLADSRDPDVRMFDKTEYKLIDFQKQEVSNYEVPSEKRGIEVTSKKFVKNLLKSEVKVSDELEQLFFVVNEGNFFIIKDKDGKQVADNHGNVYKINAKEVRISPNGNRIAYLRKDDVLICAKLQPKIVNERGDVTTDAKVTNEWPVDLENIAGGQKFVNGYKGNLSQVSWITNGLLAIGKFIGKTTPPQEFLIIRASNGQAFCKFNLKKEYSFIKNSSQPNLVSPCHTGILDRRTNKLYDISGLSLIQLGAKRFNLKPNSEIFMKEAAKVGESSKIAVLGLLAPALFFPSLNQLNENNGKLSKQEELIQDSVFRYSVLVNENGENQAKLQNMFHHLCEMNRPELLKIWLLKDSNYFSDGESKSPMASTTIVTCKQVNDWLRENDEDRTRSIYSGFRTDEFIKILRLPISMSEEILTNLTYNFNKHLSFNSANLEEGEFTTIPNIDTINEKPTQVEIMKQLTEFKDGNDIPEKGDPFNFYATLIKFPLIPGTSASKKLIYQIAEAGEENPEIFKNKLIIQLLQYKFQAVKWLVHVLITIHVSYLLCVLFFPLYPELNDRWMVGTYLGIFTIREFLQLKSLCAQARRVEDTSFTDYFSFWNFIDYTNMFMMLTYMIWHKPESYALMGLLTWINLLQYLRLYPFFRFFVDLIKGVFLYPDTWKFFIVMITMLMAFSSAFFILYMKNCYLFPDDPEKCPADTDELDHGLIPIFYGQIYLSFGDFASEGHRDEGLMQTFIFWFGVIFMCLIMLNLLITILGEAMGNILADKDMTDIQALNDIVFDLESVMFWVRQDEDDETGNQHLVFGEQVDTLGGEENTDTRVEKVEEKVNLIDQKVDYMMEMVEKLVGQK